MINPTAVIELLKVWYPGHNWPDETWVCIGPTGKTRRRRGVLQEAMRFRNRMYEWGYAQPRVMSVWIPRGEYDRAYAILEMSLV